MGAAPVDLGSSFFIVLFWKYYKLWVIKVSNPTQIGKTNENIEDSKTWLRDDNCLFVTNLLRTSETSLSLYNIDKDSL